MLSREKIKNKEPEMVRRKKRSDLKKEKVVIISESDL